MIAPIELVYGVAFLLVMLVFLVGIIIGIHIEKKLKGGNIKKQ